MDKSNSVIRHEAGAIVVGEEGGKPLITFNANGTISFAKRLRPDTAAQLFMDSLARELVRRAGIASLLPPAPAPAPLVDTGEGAQPDPQVEVVPEGTTDAPKGEPELFPYSEEITLETEPEEGRPAHPNEDFSAQAEEGATEAAQVEGEAVEAQQSAQDASLL